MRLSDLIVFDIETCAVPFEELDTPRQEYITRRATTDEEKAQKIREMALSPMTAQCICIGLMIMRAQPDGTFQRERIGALGVDPLLLEDDERTVTIELGEDEHAKLFLSSERHVLQRFWQLLDRYPHARLVSFNGREFDAPFLMLRSAILRVRPSKNLMSGTRWNHQDHIDLLEELTYNSFKSSGATKVYNFDFYARTFGIPSPKSGGLDGSLVAQAFAEGKMAEIAEYCLRDVQATWQLFTIWREYLAF